MKLKYLIMVDNNYLRIYPESIDGEYISTLCQNFEWLSPIQFKYAVNNILPTYPSYRKIELWRMEKINVKDVS